jgi:hypothetical protein
MVADVAKTVLPALGVSAAVMCSGHTGIIMEDSWIKLLVWCIYYAVCDLVGQDCTSAHDAPVLLSYHRVDLSPGTTAVQYCRTLGLHLPATIATSSSTVRVLEQAIAAKVRRV